MTTFMLIISIIFNLINLFIILIIWKKYSLTDLSLIDDAKKDIEDLLITYTAEIREDNEKLVDFINSLQLEGSKKFDSELNKVNTKINLVVDDNVKIKYDADPTLEKQEVGSKQINEVINIKDQAILLSKEGIPLEEIAKKLGKGKGEIELLLKFHKE